MLATSYSTRRNEAVPASKSSSSQAARGSPSRGWPTEPGLSSLRPGPSAVVVPLGGEAAVQDVVFQRDRQRNVAVADEHERRLGQLERDAGHVCREHVLPDRVARARVEELDPVPRALRPQRLQERARAFREHGARPARRHDRVAGELLQVDLAEHPEIVVPRQADRRTPLDRRAARIRPRPVTDEVAQAPELVRLLQLQVLEHGLERVPVTVDVRDDGDALRQGDNLSGPRRGLARGCVAPEPDERAGKPARAPRRCEHDLPGRMSCTGLRATTACCAGSGWPRRSSPSPRSLCSFGSRRGSPAPGSSAASRPV